MTIGTERSEFKQTGKISSKAMLNSLIGNKNGKSNDLDENNQLAIESHINADRGVTIRAADARGQ